MKQIITVYSNPHFTQDDNSEDFKLKTNVELVIVHTDGKEYKVQKDRNLVSTTKLSEIRLLVTPHMLQELITDLQMHQKQLNNFKANADQINSLVKHLKDKE